MDLGITVKLSGSPRINSFASFLTRGERDAILRKVGAKLKFLTVQNFGFNGTNRPSQWAPLSPRYSKRVKRSIATLELSGDLFRSLRVGEPDGNSITVSTDNKYAAAHQNGNERLPARPFFPITPDGSATPYAQRVLETTAALEMQAQMRRLK
jgi:phage gpG-like protein